MVILAVRFAAELFGFAAAAVLGASVPLAQPWPTLLAIATPVALIVFWGLVAAPKARNPLPPVARELIGTAVLLLVAAFLGVTGQAGLAAAYASIVVVDHAVIIVRDPRPEAERRLALTTR